MRSTLKNKKKTFVDLPEEVWVPIFRDYQISNMGRVASSKGRRIKILKTYLTWRKYHIIHFRINGKRKAHTVHRLVALIFNKNIDLKRNEVNHLFGKDDNRAISLSWVSQKENNQHAIDNNLFLRGEQISTKLDKTQAKTIKSLRKQLGQLEVANYFKVSRATVGLIMLGKIWAHL